MSRDNLYNEVSVICTAMVHSYAIVRGLCPVSLYKDTEPMLSGDEF